MRGTRGWIALANSVCAVIITHHPAPEHLDNAIKTRRQVLKLVVVDNGSSVGELTPFRAARESPDFHLIENRENLGVAAALNIGIKWAWSQGCDWVILLDQDSTVTDGLVDTLHAAYLADPDRDRVGTIVPKYISTLFRRMRCRWNDRRRGGYPYCFDFGQPDSAGGL